MALTQIVYLNRNLYPTLEAHDSSCHSTFSAQYNFSRLSARSSLCSESKLKARRGSANGNSWNPLSMASRNLQRRGMRIRGSHAGVADGGYIPQYNENVKATSPLESEPSATKTPPKTKPTMVERIEGMIERMIFDCRFFALFAVVGSLAGSLLCFLQGSMFVVHSFREFIRAYMHNMRSSQVILFLVEAVDVYLMGTVMLIFGMGLYELFVSTLEVPEKGDDGAPQTPSVRGSNLFGLFPLQARPKWLGIRSLDELKTKLGHVIVMILLVGMFEKSKKVPIHTGLDLLCLAGSIVLASGGLYLLSNLHNDKTH